MFKSNVLEDAYTFRLIDAVQVSTEEEEEYSTINNKPKNWFYNNDVGHYFITDIEILDLKELQYKVHVIKLLRSINYCALFFASLVLASIVIGVYLYLQ